MKKTWIPVVLFAAMAFSLAAQERKTTLTVNDSGECSKNVNFTGTVMLNSLNIATQAYSSDLVTSHNADGTAHPDKMKTANNLSDLLSVSTARSNLGLKSAAVLDAGTGANNVPQLDSSGKLLSSIFPASGVTAGTYGSSTLVPVIIVDSYGRITGISTVSVSGGSWGSITGTLANQTDLQTALNAKISAPSSPATGDILYWSGTAWVSLAKGTDGQALILSSGLPAWLSASGLGDMLVSVYDPNSKGADAFDMDNMTEGSTNLILTDSERTNISNSASHGSSTSNPHGVTLDQAAAAGAATTVDVTVGDDLGIGDGTDTDKTIYANNGDANKPAIKYDYAGSKWQYSNDGSTFSDMGSGSGGSGDGATIETATGDLTSNDIGKPVTPMLVAGDSYVKMLLHFDGTNGAQIFTDSSYNTTVTAYGNASLSTTSPHFGTASLYLDGSGDAVGGTFIPPGTGAFTLDMWVKPSSLYNYEIFFSTRVSAGSSSTYFSFGTDAAGTFVFYNNGARVLDISGVIGAGSWQHIELGYDGSTVYGFVNGTLVGSAASSLNLTGSTFSIGANPAGAYNELYTGYIDELRYSKGVCRHIASFTAPGIAYPDASFAYDISPSKAAQNIASRTTTVPTIAAGTGAGTSPTVSVAGTDNSGQITVTAGSSPSAAATIATVTFASTYLNTPYVVISPANANAAALYSTTRVYATSSASAITLTAGSAALTASTQYIWNYHAF